MPEVWHKAPYDTGKNRRDDDGRASTKASHVLLMPALTLLPKGDHATFAQLHRNAHSSDLSDVRMRVTRTIAVAAQCDSSGQWQALAKHWQKILSTAVNFETLADRELLESCEGLNAGSLDRYFTTDELSEGPTGDRQDNWKGATNSSEPVTPRDNGGGTDAVVSGRKLEFIHKGATFTFVTIDAGSFQMGSPAGESFRYDNERQHEVTISKGFLMQTTEVTRGQYRAITGSYPEDKHNCRPKGNQDNHPAACVDWEDAKRFIQLLNAEVSGNPYRLPTEAEWEFAARCGTTGPYSKDGVSVSDSSLASANIAWFRENSNGGSNPVRQLEANKCGLHDVHGNVWEWVEDFYQEDYSDQKVDPEVAFGSVHVVRGGGWFNPALVCRSATREGIDPGWGRLTTIGFRLVRAKN